MCWCTVLVIGPITLPGSSSSLSWPCSVSWSSSSSRSSQASELARSLQLSPLATIISFYVLSGCQLVNSALSAFLVSSRCCWTAASVSSTSILAPAVSLSTESTIHVCFSSLLMRCVSRRHSATSYCLDHKLDNAPWARTPSAGKSLMPLFAWWYRWVDRFVELPYVPGGSSEKCIFRSLTMFVCVDFVVGRDVGCCKIWTIWRRGASFMSRLVRLLILNKPKTQFWLSLKRK